MAAPRRSAAALEGAAGARVLVVEAPYYEDIGRMLLDGARRAATEAGASVEVVSVPGALEIPQAVSLLAARAAATGAPFDAAVALGCIVRGETYHFEIVANESARGLTDVALARALPIGNGILTVENDEQAIVRADPAQGDKGGEAMRAALTLVALVRGGAR